MFSLVVPVYKNEGSLNRLLERLAEFHRIFGGAFEAVLVVDGSPDRCLEILSQELPAQPFRSRLISLSRNFGAFSAIVAGMRHAAGDSIAVMAADLQDPPELIVEFKRVMENGEADVVFGQRTGRSDPALSRWFSQLYWAGYRRFVNAAMPKGGVDVFGCTRAVCDQLTAMRERPNNLIGLLFWVGFRRTFVPYERRQRLEGGGSWTIAKKLEYGFESIFNFTDLPIRLLLYAGAGGMVFALVCSAVVVLAKVIDHIPVAGYTPIVLAIMFFGGLSCLGLGIVGEYLWLTLQHSRGRPAFLVASDAQFPGAIDPTRPYKA